MTVVFAGALLTASRCKRPQYDPEEVFTRLAGHAIRSHLGVAAYYCNHGLTPSPRFWWTTNNIAGYRHCYAKPNVSNDEDLAWLLPACAGHVEESREVNCSYIGDTVPSTSLQTLPLYFAQ